MFTPPSANGTGPPAKGDCHDLQAEVKALRQTLKDALREKDRALRILRGMNSELDGRIRGQTGKLDSLNRLIRSINYSLDLDEVATLALDGLRSSLDVQAASLAILGDEGEIRYVKAYPPEVMLVLASFRLKLGQGIIGKVLQTGEAHMAVDVRNDPAFFRDVDARTGFETRSMFCQPLSYRGRVIGAVQLINKSSGPFNGSDQAFVETVAGSLAVAVENARMHEEVRSRLHELERKNAELLETQSHLVESGKLAAIGQLTAGVAHEINNPLGILLGYAQLLSQQAQETEVKEYAGVIEREARRMKKIVGNLLGFARRTTPGDARVDLRELVERALELVDYPLRREKIQVQRLTSQEPNWVRGDGDQLLQVLLNLIQNARHAMPGGGRLTIRTWNDGDHCSLSVADSGVGIPESDLPQLFRPFFTTKPLGQGTGLGLFISSGIVTSHGGDIGVQSQPGEGSLFTVRLPQAQEPLPPGPGLN